MAIKYRTTGFVFKKNDRDESDQIFSVFTKDFGRVGLRAKAIRKITSKLKAGIDIFYLSEIEFIQGKNHKTLTDAVKIKKFGEIFEDQKKIKVAYDISDVLDIFLKGQDKDEAVFELLNKIFDNLEGNIKNHRLAFQYFFWNFISLQGYHLHTKECVICKDKLNPHEIYFSAKDGGAICGNCSAGKKASPEQCRRINSDVVKVLRLILKKDWATLSKLKIDGYSQNLLEEISQNAMQTFSPN